MKKKEKIDFVVWLKAWFLNVLFSGIITGIGVHIGVHIAKSHGVLIMMEVVEMFEEYLPARIDSFWFVLMVLIFMAIIVLILRIVWAPLPRDIITIREYKIAKAVRGEVSKYPSLRFTLEVINRSYIRFKPKRVEIKCYNEGEKVGEDYWEKGMEKNASSYDSAKGYISVSPELVGYGESSINFEVPIEKKYEHLESWELHGYVQYTRRCGMRKYKKIDTVHYLSKQADDDLQKKLEEALGEAK